MDPELPVYLTATDAANILEMSSAGVRDASNSQRLRVAATTPKGVRLYLRADVEAFKRERRTWRGRR